MQRLLGGAGITANHIAYHCPWQNGVTERVIGTLRRELLDHIIPLNETDLLRLLREYVHRDYNPARTNQGIDRHTPVPPESPPTPAELTTPLEVEPLLGGLYHTYRRAA